MRIASPQTAEDAEQLREHAAAFMVEKYPAPSGPDPSSVGGAAEFKGAAGELRGAYGRETAAASVHGLRQDAHAGKSARRLGLIDEGFKAGQAGGEVTAFRLCRPARGRRHSSEYSRNSPPGSRGNSDWGRPGMRASAFWGSSRCRTIPSPRVMKFALSRCAPASGSSSSAKTLPLPRSMRAQSAPVPALLSAGVDTCDTVAIRFLA